ncbi:HAAS signaling domain-containing protein [Actinoplanes teichomyceticus]|uniref:Uncharacterized protein n=1 Tax=Actinoplanes teichomyceticus TaxID=1867 RepID=A0A561WSD7_ACTTI|nr:hypothetical protein [Actinoplanes teichomyceticus]TWG26772.1 hypothetical protein FHX34_1011770 [Actinoplanes teichomyceticus]GIF15170.1 hypothetical protein Ate01nite_52020 [Actinoplanes teichomyceticus]
MKPDQTDVVGEYLHEVDLRLSGLPLLQRRELLADLAAHIATERTERNVRSEGELLEILERLGSPEVVAAAAYEEAGAARTPTATAPVAPRPAPTSQRHRWIIGAVAVVGLVIVLCLGAALTMSRGESGPAPAPVAPAQAP